MYDDLTPRQREVFDLLAKGKANKIIAYDIGLKESTVKFHIRHIMRKFGARTRTEIVAIHHSAAANRIPDGVTRVYLAGPMTGIPEFNYPEFHRVAALLRKRGYYVFSPAEWWTGGFDTFPVRDAFAAFTRFICLEADMLVMLPGWQQSKGATAEYRLAQAIGVLIEDWKE